MEKRLPALNYHPAELFLCSQFRLCPGASAAAGLGSGSRGTGFGRCLAFGGGFSGRFALCLGFSLGPGLLTNNHYINLLPIKLIASDS